MANMSFQSYIDRLKGVYTAMDERLVLKKGATEKVQAAVERRIGFAIDEPLRAAWKLSNGAESVPFFARPGYLLPYRFISIKEALEHREVIRDRSDGYVGYSEPKPRDERISKEWHEVGWLPFAVWEVGDAVLMSDLAPARKGKPGQIIGYVHDPDKIVYVASGFGTFLSQSMKAIQDDPDEYFGRY